MSNYFYENASAFELKSLMEREDLQFHNPSIFIEENAVILPKKKDPTGVKVWGLGGVCNEKGEFIKASEEPAFGGEYEVDEQDVIYESTNAIYLGYLIPHWGVFMVDLMRRAYVFSLLTPEDLKNYKVAFCGMDFEEGTFGKISKNCYEFFERLGIDKTQLVDIRRPTRFAKVLIPSQGYDYSGRFSKEFIYPYTVVANSVQNSTKYADKIYLTRTRFWQHKEFGEKIIERFFRQNGYDIVSPERLSFLEQIEIFKGAKIIASLEGTIAHNILFADLAKKQIIIRKQSELNYRQIAFNKAKEIEVEYIDCYYEPYKGFPINHDIGPFLLLFNKNIKKFAEDNRMVIPRNYVWRNIIEIYRYTVSCVSKRREYKWLR